MYGKGCMFKRARIAQRIETMGRIETYKKFLQEKKYTLKQIKVILVKLVIFGVGEKCILK